MMRIANIFFWFSLSIIASLALYHTSDRTRALESRLREVNADVDGEQEKLHVLNAEWVYLINPARIETVAKKFLPLKVTSPVQVIAMTDLETALPVVPEKTAAVATPFAVESSNALEKVAVAKEPKPDLSEHVTRHAVALPHKTTVTAILPSPSTSAVLASAVPSAPSNAPERKSIRFPNKDRSIDKIGSLIASLDQPR